MPTITSDNFWAVLEKSGLFAPDELAQAREQLAGEEDPKNIARALFKAGKINKWQANQLLRGRYALTLGKYKLLDLIGDNQHERAFLAEHKQLGRQVAIKTLSRRQTSEKPELVEAFLAKAKKLAALDHRNIIHVYDVDNDNDRYYLVTEFIEGRSLRQIVDEDGPLPFERAAKYLARAAAGLSFAHQQNLVHRDIRPSNLLVDVQDDIKLLNLEFKGLIGGQADDDSSVTSLEGEWDFASPEQIKDDQEIDFRSDLYSLGCTMHFLLTGKAPFRGDRDHIQQSHLSAQPDDLAEHRPDVPDELADLCRSLMSKDAKDRPASAADVEARLSQWLATADAETPRSSEKPSTVGQEKPAPPQRQKKPTPSQEKKPAPIEAKKDAGPAKAKTSGAEVPGKTKAAGNGDDSIKINVVDTKKRPAGKSPSPERREQKSAEKKPTERINPQPSEPGAVKATGKEAAKEVKPEKPGQDSKNDSADRQSPKKKTPSEVKATASDAPKVGLPKSEKIAIETKQPKASGPAGFAIETGPKRRRKKGKASEKPGKPAAKAPAAATAETEAADGAAEKAEPANTSGTAKGGMFSPIVLIIGGASLAGLLLVVGVVVAVMWMMSGSTEVADNTNGNAEAEAGSNGGDATDPDQSNASDLESDPESDIDPSDLESDVTVASPTTTQPNPPDEEPVTDDPSAKPGGPPEPGPNEVAKTDTGDEKVVKPEAKPPTDPPAAKTEPEDKPKEPSKPTSAPKPKQAAPPKKDKKPFQDLPANFALAGTEDTTPQELGSIYVPEDDLCFIKLRGGEAAFKGSQQFMLRNANSGLAERDWDISVQQGEGRAATKVAALKLDESNKLTFKWEPAAKDAGVADYLKNCVFSFSCAGQSHLATLRQASVAEPLAIDLEKPALKQDWEIDMPPQTEAIKVQITKLTGVKFSVDPPIALDADKGEAWVRIEDGGGALSLLVTTSMKKDLSVTIKPFAKYTADGKPEPLSKRRLQQFAKTAEAQVLGMQNQVTAMQTAMKQQRLGEREKRFAEQRMRNFEQLLTESQAVLKQLQDLDKAMSDFGSKVQMHMRVFYDADSSEVDLLKIGG